MANIKLKLEQEVDIGKVDSTLVVYAANSPNSKKLIGKLRFSKGTVDWWPNGNSANCHSYTWPQLARLLEQDNKVRKPAVKKTPGKEIAAKKAVTKRISSERPAAKAQRAERKLK